MKLEDLSNELVYEIFEYFDHLEISEIFSNFNERFRNLFQSLTCRIKIRFGNVSRLRFESYYKNVILPNQDQIQSLVIFDPCISNSFLNSSISLLPKLVSLQAFVINNVPSNYLEDLVNHLSLLPNLCSLVIHSKYYVEQRNQLYNQISQLSSLKSFEWSIQDNGLYDLLPVATNSLSSITNLVVGDIIRIGEFVSLLSYFPQLHHLSIRKLSRLYGSRDSNLKVVNQLKDVRLDVGDVYFDDFEPLIKNLFNEVEIFQIRVPADKNYIIANRWESLIGMYMTHLKVFDIHQRVMTNQPNYGEDYMHLIDQFQSPFWFERQWFFALHMRLFESNCQLDFFSTDPYRKKQFNLEFESRKRTTPSSKQIPMSSVYHLQIQDENCLNNWTTYFPNVTQLTLKLNYFFEEEQKYISSTILNRFLPLQQITELNIYVSYSYFEDFLKLINSLPNLHKLHVTQDQFYRIEVNSLKFNETSSIISFPNKIKCVTIEIPCSFEDMILLVNLFPQMERLTISRPQIEIVQYLFSEKNQTMPHLQTIQINNSDSSAHKKIINLIQSQNLPIDWMTDDDRTIQLYWYIN